MQVNFLKEHTYYGRISNVQRETMDISVILDLTKLYWVLGNVMNPRCQSMKRGSLEIKFTVP